MRRRGRHLCEPHPRGCDGRERAGALVRVGQPAQGRRAQRRADRRMPDQPQADPGEEEGGVAFTMTIRPRRSLLYMPGSNARAIEKARSLPADAVILDLEDSVAPPEKAAARAQVAQAVRTGGFGPREVVVRVNGLDTPWGLDDLNTITHAKPDAILVPKVSSPDQLDDIIERIFD